MSDDNAEAFLDRVFPKLAELNKDKFSNTSWKFENRPTSEGVGMIPGQSLDVQTTVDCILDVLAYPENVQFVVENTFIDQRSDTDFTYIQRMSLPLLGKIQCALNLADYGDLEGYRVVAWTQNDEETDKLSKKDGFRTEYNLGAWLIRENELYYALSSCPRKKDVGSLKFAIMTRGADATAGEILRKNIDAMSSWSQRS